MKRRPQPELDARLLALASELGEELTLDRLTRDYVMFQRRRGHRHSTDDLLTAHYAAAHATESPRSMLDLGAGVGTVGLSLVWRFPDATLTAIEVQGVSFRLLSENVWANRAEGRVRAVHGDLRALPSASYPLVTASPPYFGVNAGIVSPDPQRAGARFELRGGVEDYCHVAARSLAPGGRFVFCFPTAQRERAARACAAASLAMVTERDVVPREGRAPLFSLFSCAALADGKPGGATREAAMIVRDAEGRHTRDMLEARAFFGMGELQSTAATDE